MKVVVIGGGIVGNSLTGWLTELGWTDVVQIDLELVQEVNPQGIAILRIPTETVGVLHQTSEIFFLRLPQVF